jgi:hypothetical protein
MNQENAFPLGDTPDADARSIVIELEAHDASRFEWRIAVPLLAHEQLKGRDVTRRAAPNFWLHFLL